MTTGNDVGTAGQPAIAIGGRKKETANAQKPALLASQGSGPLLQRDYLATIKDAACSPAALMAHIRENFTNFSPDHLAAFSCDRQGALISGDEMQINIRMSGLCHVRIVHVDETSFTMRTLDGHPEAGRITFGASMDDNGDLQFRIRSRARAADTLKYVGYELFGKAMQTEVWTTFLQRVADHCQGRLDGEVRIEEREVKPTMGDRGEVDAPTFKA